LQHKETRILGIDPGLATLGFGYIVCDQERNSSVPKFLDAGIIETSSELSLGERLAVIYSDLHELLEEYRPDLVSIEKLFFYRMSTTIPVAQARGVVILVLAQLKIPIIEYTPNQVKQALTGHGKADKRSVQESVARELNLEKIITPDDASDALALALTAWLNR
jgi:crossover junction endodeoxyribonuclease RuvC